MNLSEINITSLHESIKTKLIERFPDCPLVDCYTRPGEKISTPAIFFELESVEPLDPSNIGTEQLEVELRFSAEVIVSYKQNGLLGLLLLALNIVKFVDGNRWGQPVTPGRFIEAVSETFSGPMDAYKSWRVSWSHTGLLGNNIWEESGIVPELVLVSAAPRVGIPHEPEYVPVTDGKETLS